MQNTTVNKAYSWLLGTESKLTVDGRTILENCECIAEPDGNPDLYGHIITCHYGFVQRDVSVKTNSTKLDEVLVRLKDLEAEVLALKEPGTYKGFKVHQNGSGYVVTIKGKTLFRADSLDSIHRNIDMFHREAEWVDGICRWFNWGFVWNQKYNTLGAYHLKDSVYGRGA